MGKIVNKMNMKKQDLNQKVLTNRLLKAVRYNDFAEVKYCVEAGALIDTDGLVVNPIILASQLGRRKILNYFIEKGANVNCQDSMGATPLMWAAYSDSKIIAGILIDNGADINFVDAEFGATPLIWWVSNSSGDFDKIKFLIDKGANPCVRDINNKLASDHARENGLFEIADYLKECEAKQMQLHNKLTELLPFIRKCMSRIIRNEENQKYSKRTLVTYYHMLKDLLNKGVFIDSTMIKEIKYCGEFFNDNELKLLAERQSNYKIQKRRASTTQKATQRKRMEPFTF